MEKTHSAFNRVDALLQSVKKRDVYVCVCVFVSGSLEKD
jgi:hypothetical protein